MNLLKTAIWRTLMHGWNAFGLTMKPTGLRSNSSTRRTVRAQEKTKLRYHAPRIGALAMAPRRYQRKSHLAKAINRSSPGWQIFWAVVIVLAFMFAMVMNFSH
jgi:hypothetical protein